MMASFGIEELHHCLRHYFIRFNKIVASRIEITEVVCISQMASLHYLS